MDTLDELITINRSHFTASASDGRSTEHRSGGRHSGEYVIKPRVLPLGVRFEGQGQHVVASDSFAPRS